MYTITKEFYFNATCALDNLTVDHPGSRVLGYNYVITVELQNTTLGTDGFVFDFRKLHLIKDFFSNKFQHNHLNEVVDVNPSIESLAKYIFECFVKTYPISSVTVQATPGMTAKYSPEYD